MKKLNDPLAWISEDEERNPIGIEIDVEKVIVKNRKRETDEKKVNELVESIKEIGLISPIYVNRSGDDYILIAGLHRLTAYKKLGIDRIPAKIVDIDDIHSELAEIDENLVRAELHYLDRAELLKRRQEIYEELHPEAKAEEKKKRKGSNYAEFCDETVSLQNTPDTFTADTAKKTNLTERTIQQDLQIAKNLDGDVKKQIKEKKISKGEALKIARLKKEDQQKAIEDNSNTSAKEIRKAKREAEKLSKKEPGKFESYKERNRRYDEAVNKLREEKIIIEAYKSDIYTYEEAEKILADVYSESIEEARILLSPYAAKETGKEPEQKTDKQEAESLEYRIEEFNITHTDIVLEIGKPKDIKSHMLPLMATGEPPVIKIAFKSRELVNDLINILNKAFSVK